MQSSPPLHKTFLFWLALITPIVISITLVYFIDGSKLPFNNPISSSDLQLIFSAYQLPLGIAGLSIPLVAMIATLHRSSQTALQITAQQKQNNIVNHFKHLEEFKEHLEEKEKSITYWGGVEVFYSIIFPNSIKGSFDPNIKLKEIDSFFEQFHKSASSAFLDGEAEYNDLITNFENALQINKNSIKARPLNPDLVIELSVLVNDAVRFSGLHPGPLDIEKYRADLDSYSKFIPAQKALLAFIDKQNLSEEKFLLRFFAGTLSKQIPSQDEDALILFINNLWRSLPDQEKEKINDAIEFDKHPLYQYVISNDTFRKRPRNDQELKLVESE